MKTIDSILRKEIRRSAVPLIAVGVLMLAMIGFDIIAPWPFKILIDNVLSAAPLSAPAWLNFLEPIFQSRYLLGFLAVFIYFLSTFAFSITEYAKNIYTKQVIKRITADFSKKAFQNLQALSIGFYKDQDIGDYIYRLSYDVSAIGELLENGILPLLTSAIYIISTVGIMFAISFKLTLLAFTILPILAIGLISFNSAIAKATRRSEYFNSASFSFIEEALTHLKIIQAFSQEKKQSKRFDKKTDASLGGDVSLYRLDFILSLTVGLIIAISYSLIIIMGIRQVFGGLLTTGFLIVFIFYLDNLTVPIQDMIFAATESREAYVKIARMREFFTRKTQLDTSGGENLLSRTGIRFSKVGYKGEEGKAILHDISFNIPEGKRTVIFGESGSGKTTVVNLILRFIDKPNSGEIFLGGLPLERYQVETLRSSIAYVPQEVTLFNQSILSNIKFGNSKSSLKDVENAARMADADEFISKLPGKYGFKVGEGGNLLSGGQRQRIMLARALLRKDAKILLFDETLSALDVKTRMEVLRNLYRVSAKRTTILVSNIFDVARQADHVILLDNGRVIYEGPAKHLPREKSIYDLLVKNSIKHESSARN